uniref:Cytochrome c oxidase subunit 2 n=1 Tax=Typhlodromus pineus TaxID=3061201 RepID=A0AAU6QEI7_9ACAR
MMSYWCDLYFMNANSPSMEQLIFFHDHSMMVMIFVMIFLLLKLMFMKLNKVIQLNFLENQNLEIVWTIFPIFLLILIVLPSIRLLYLMEESFNSNLTLKVLGHQWYWSYEYSDFNFMIDCFIKLSDLESSHQFRVLETDEKILLPINCFFRILISSVDVIHSWTIPSLGVKADAIPGRLNQINFFINRPGYYFGQCSEICGSNHSFMPICLKIMSLKNFLNFIKIN